MLTLSGTSPVYRKMIDAYNRTKEFEFLGKNPNAIRWKSIALILYKSGEEASLDELFKFVRSPEGKC